MEEAAQKMRDGQGRNIDFGVKKFKKMKEGDPSAWGKASTTVHTTAEQALAFVWLYCSNLRMKEHQKNDGNLREAYEPVTTDTATVPPAQHRTQHFVVQRSMPPPLQPRETNMRFVWSKMNNSKTTITMKRTLKP